MFDLRTIYRTAQSKEVIDALVKADLAKGKKAGGLRRLFGVGETGLSPIQWVAVIKLVLSVLSLFLMKEAKASGKELSVEDRSFLMIQSHDEDVLRATGDGEGV